MAGEDEIAVACAPMVRVLTEYEVALDALTWLVDRHVEKHGPVGFDWTAFSEALRRLCRAAEQEGEQRGYERAREQAIELAVRELGKTPTGEALGRLTPREARRIADVLDGIGRLGESIRMMQSSDLDDQQTTGLRPETGHIAAENIRSGVITNRWLAGYEAARARAVALCEARAARWQERIDAASEQVRASEAEARICADAIRSMKPESGE